MWKSKKCKKKMVSDHFWNFEVLEKMHAFVARNTLEVKMLKARHIQTTFGIRLWFRVVGAKDGAPCQK